MKKFGVLLCLLLGLTACGLEQRKVPDFATLDEAIENYKEETDQVEEITQAETVYMVALSISASDFVELEGDSYLGEQPVVYYMLFEETEKGFVFRYQTPKNSLGHGGFSGEADWKQRADGSNMKYELWGYGYGDHAPDEKEIAEASAMGFGEVHERDGMYFSVKMEFN